MIRLRDLPADWAHRFFDRTTWLADRALESSLRDAGLDRLDVWDRLLDRTTERRPGRGSTTRIALPDGRELVLKALRRGGWAAALWRDRHVGTGRLVRNVTVPLELRRRGVATPAARVLLAVAGPPGLYRGWLALDALDGEDALSWMAREPEITTTILAPAMATVRRAHDVGLRHPDLNLGNLFMTADGTAQIIDLDGAVVRDAPLGTWDRFRELLRLERSWLRHLGSTTVDGRSPGQSLVRSYAAGDDELLDRLTRLRPVGRAILRVRGVSDRPRSD